MTSVKHKTAYFDFFLKCVVKCSYFKKKVFILAYHLKETITNLENKAFCQNIYS